MDAESVLHGAVARLFQLVHELEEGEIQLEWMHDVYNRPYGCSREIVGRHKLQPQLLLALLKEKASGRD